MTNNLCSMETSPKVRTYFMVLVALLIFSRTQVPAEEERATVTVTLLRAAGTFADGKRVFLYKQDLFGELTVRIREDGTQDIVFPGEPAYQALTNDRGLAVFQQVSSGQYIMTAERILLGGDSRCFEDIGYVPVVVSRGSPRKEIGILRYAKRGVVIRGKAFIAGKPASDVVICEWDRVNGIARQKCVSGADGRYELYLETTPLKGKQIALRACKEGYTPCLTFVNLEESIIEEVDFSLEPLETWDLLVTSPPPSDPAHKEFVLLISTSPQQEFGIDHPVLPVSAGKRHFQLPKGNWLCELVVTGWGFSTDGEPDLLAGGQTMRLWRAGEKDHEQTEDRCIIAISCKFLCAGKALPSKIVRLLFSPTMILVIRHPKYETNFLPAMLNMIELDEKLEGILEDYAPPIHRACTMNEDTLADSVLEVWLASKDVTTGFYVFERRLDSITDHGLRHDETSPHRKHELKLDVINLLRKLVESPEPGSRTRARLHFESMGNLLRSYQEIETDKENKLALKAVVEALEKLATEYASEGK